MSVVPVREAIRQLEAEGFVTYERNVGAQVAMVDEHGYVDGMVALGVVEGAATALAAPDSRPPTCSGRREINDRLRATLDHFDPLPFTTLNREFHSVLFTKCVNARWSPWCRPSGPACPACGPPPSRSFPAAPTNRCASTTPSSTSSTAGATARDRDAARRHRSATLDAFLAPAPQRRRDDSSVPRPTP